MFHFQVAIKLRTHKGVCNLVVLFDSNLKMDYSISKSSKKGHSITHRLFCQICTFVDELTNLCNQATPLIRLLYLSRSLEPRVVEGFYCICETFYKSSLVLQHENNTNSIQMVSLDICVNYIRFWLSLIRQITSNQSHIYQHESQHST